MPANCLRKSLDIANADDKQLTVDFSIEEKPSSPESMRCFLGDDGAVEDDKVWRLIDDKLQCFSQNTGASNIAQGR